MNKILLLLAIASTVAAVDAHHSIIVMAGAAVLSPDNFQDMIAGYVDGLMGIQIRGQLDKCHDVTYHAQLTFSKSVDNLRDAITNWLEPFTNKVAAFHDSIYWILQITPGMVEDFQHCPIITEDTKILEGWSERHPDKEAFA